MLRPLYDHPAKKERFVGSDMTYETWNGIQISTETRKRFADFEAIYAHLRSQEGRTFSAEEIKQLPATEVGHPHHAEWELRKHTISALLNYLKNKGDSFSILDIGCGNGFFSNLMAQLNNKVIGIDVSLFELEQAVHIFGEKNPTWYYADIMKDELPVLAFDLITIHAALPYFPDPTALLHRCVGLLKPGGEVHILESPVYEDQTAAAKAREKSQRHFQSMDAQGMMQFYHFHTWDVFKGFNYSVRLTGNSLLHKVLRINRSPFPWIIVKNA